MKKLALLLLALPLAACTSPVTPQERSAQVAQAINVCTADPEGQIADALDPLCVNGYLQSHYGYQLAPAAITDNCSSFTSAENCAEAVTPYYRSPAYKPSALSHWQVVTGNGAFLAPGAEAWAAGGPVNPYPPNSP